MNAKAIAAAGLTCLLLLWLATGAAAQPRERHERGWHGDVRHFHEHDISRWRGGRWYQGRHGGHFGWWWIVGGVYYWYPRAIYPYPDPFVPSVYIERQPPGVLAPAVPQPAPPAPPPSIQQPHAPAPAAAATWYYCDSAKSYYPYVATCPGGWHAVPAAPNPPPR